MGLQGAEELSPKSQGWWLGKPQQVTLVPDAVLVTAWPSMLVGYALPPNSECSQGWQVDKPWQVDSGTRCCPSNILAQKAGGVCSPPTSECSCASWELAQSHVGGLCIQDNCQRSVGSELALEQGQSL